MSLDHTAKESNVKDSIKKFFVDNIYTAEGIHLSFDRFLDAAELMETSPPTILQWVTVVMGDIVRDIMGTILVDLYCCTRQDPEGSALSILSDTVMGYLTDITQTDTMKRIPFYRSDTTPWTLLGALLVHEIQESRELVAPDKSKYKMITAVLRWSAKV